METEKKFITDDLEIIGIFKEFARSRKNLWAWQQNVDQNGKRPVHFITIKKVDPIKKTIIVFPNNSDGFRFTKGSEIFLFCSDRGFAIKTPVRELEKDFITIPLPARLNICLSARHRLCHSALPPIQSRLYRQPRHSHRRPHRAGFIQLWNDLMGHQPYYW